MYAKVFRSLFYGSLCGQPDPQLVFICLLTHADQDGHVELPCPVIAAVCGLPLERVSMALALLEAPDPLSRTESSDGRRIEPTVDGGGRWQIVNYGRFRSMRDEDDRRRQSREAQARHKAKRSPVSQGKPPVSHGQPRKSQGEVEGEGEVEVELEDPTAPPAQSLRAATRLSGRQPANGSVGLPTNANGEWHPTQAELEAWAQAYPAMDVAGTMLEMRAWLIANPERRKTERGMARFVNRWLAKEQDRS